ncbi:MAG: hypothetical protein WBE26_20335 [Phycisphaerae bacterium]
MISSRLPECIRVAWASGSLPVRLPVPCTGKQVCPCHPKQDVPHVPGRRRQRSYVLLETVVATGLLVVGLSVVGAQLQDADTSIRKMERQIRAMSLAEQQFAELDLGLIELDSVDEVQEEDFGERYPDWAWRLTIEDTALEEMFLLKTEILYLPREGEYQEDDFDFDEAETLFTLYAMRPTPQPVNFALDFGLTEDEMIELGTKLADLGIPGFDDPEAVDTNLIPKLPFDELLEALPLIMDALGMDLSGIVSQIPPGLLQQIQDSGLFGEEGEGGVEGILDGLGPDEGS